MTDTYTWGMSAVPHAGAINALRRDIIDAHSSAGKVPINTVLNLLPINTPNAQELIERTAFEFHGDVFSSKGTALRMEVFDDVLDTYYIDVPADWKGTAKVNAETVELSFDPPLDMELPKLAQLGVGRSKFQKLVGIKGDASRVVSELKDVVNNGRTLLDVHIKNDTPPLDAGLQGRMIGMMSSPCPSGDPNATDWYVLSRDGQPGMCVIHQGSPVYGGQMAYTTVFGPATYDDCVAYAQQNCPLGY